MKCIYYTHLLESPGFCKGDARITYLKQESVGIAEQFLHERFLHMFSVFAKQVVPKLKKKCFSYIRPDCKVSVEKASFTMKGDSFVEKKQVAESSKRLFLAQENCFVIFLLRSSRPVIPSGKRLRTKHHRNHYFKKQKTIV